MLIKKKPIIGTFWETKNEKERKRERVRNREGERGRGRGLQYCLDKVSVETSSLSSPNRFDDLPSLATSQL